MSAGARRRRSAAAPALQHLSLWRGREIWPSGAETSSQRSARRNKRRGERTVISTVIGAQQHSVGQGEFKSGFAPQRPKGRICTGFVLCRACVALGPAVYQGHADKSDRCPRARSSAREHPSALCAPCKAVRWSRRTSSAAVASRFSASAPSSSCVASSSCVLLTCSSRASRSATPACALPRISAGTQRESSRLRRSGAERQDTSLPSSSASQRTLSVQAWSFAA